MCLCVFMCVHMMDVSGMPYHIVGVEVRGQLCRVFLSFYLYVGSRIKPRPSSLSSKLSQPMSHLPSLLYSFLQYPNNLKTLILFLTVVGICNLVKHAFVTCLVIVFDQHGYIVFYITYLLTYLKAMVQSRVVTYTYDPNI